LLNTAYQTIRLFFLLLMMLFLNTSWAEPIGHKSCTDCHLTATPASDGSDLIQPVTTLCISCHKYGGNSDHAVGVPPGVDGTGELPLVAGKIACITCHNMHAETRMLLRINTEELCLACHPDH